MCPTEKQEKFESEFELEKLKKMSEVDILPKIEFDEGIKNAKIVVIDGTYYDFDLPDKKMINKKKTVKALNFLYEGTKHYFIAEQESFRIQLDAIRYKRGLNKLSDIDGLKLKIWKEEKQLDTPNFKGKAMVYCLEAL